MGRINLEKRLFKICHEILTSEDGTGFNPYDLIDDALRRWYESELKKKKNPPKDDEWEI